MLQLLQQRVGRAGGEVVAGQEQHGQPVDGGQGGAGDQVGRSRADGRRDGLRRETVELAGVSDGRVHHRLLVAALVVGHDVAVLDQRLADARHVAVPEDAPRAGDQPVPFAVACGVLGGQEPHQCLGDGQTARRFTRRVAHASQV